MISVAVQGEFHGVQLKEPSKAFLNSYFDEEHKAFMSAAAIVHRKSVFEILTRIIRLCNVDTGRLRASFTPIMDYFGWKGFEQYMKQPPLEGGGKPKNFSETAVKEGKTQGSFVDAFLDTMISSNVVYAGAVNARSQYLTKALVWGDERYNNNFESFFDAAYRQGWVPEQFLHDQEEGA